MLNTDLYEAIFGGTIAHGGHIISVVHRSSVLTYDVLSYYDMIVPLLVSLSLETDSLIAQETDHWQQLTIVVMISDSAPLRAFNFKFFFTTNYCMISMDISMTIIIIYAYDAAYHKIELWISRRW